jgi:hypothetical protein
LAGAPQFIKLIGNGLADETLSLVEKRPMCETHALIALAVCAAALGFATGIPCGVALAKRRG